MKIAAEIGSAVVALDPPIAYPKPGSRVATTL
jgi:hypothetical protein